MAIPVILRGDTSSKISIVIEGDLDSANDKIILALDEIRREIDSPQSGEKIDIKLSAIETTGLSLGTHKIYVFVQNASGEIRSLPWVKVKVTDSPSEVYDVIVRINAAKLDVENATPEDNLGGVKEKMNKILEYLRGTACVAFALLFLCGAKVEDKTLNDIPGTDKVVTNVDLSDLATSEELAFVNTIATNALDKAETAQETADGAQATADTANATANTANTKATEAKTIATTANDNVTQVLQILEGDDFRITVTNYDSTVNVPMSSYDAKYTDGSTSVWKTVWVETNRHEMTKREVLNVVSNKFTSKEEAKKFRKWGNYDSVTGQDAPEGFAQCSNEGGMIFGNGAGYKSYATGSGSPYGIWQQNSGLARVETNGVFRILDADGKEAFSVTKGDKKILGADASGFYCGKLEFQATWIEIHYSVDSATHPTIEYSDTLENGGVWYKEGDSDFPLTISWTRNDTWNYWSAYLTDPRDNVQGFFRATYEAGADTVVSVGSTPMALEYIYLGGKKYKLGTATINSNTVLTLTEVQ